MFPEHLPQLFSAVNGEAYRIGLSPDQGENQFCSSILRVAEDFGRETEELDSVQDRVIPRSASWRASVPDDVIEYDRRLNIGMGLRPPRKRNHMVMVCV